MTTPTPKPIPASVLRELANAEGAIGWKEPDTEPGEGLFVTASDLARELLALQEAARDLCASLHADAHGATASECYDRLRALLPEGE